jgi:hypothetical protein
MIEEHHDLLASAKALVDRAKGHATATDLARDAAVLTAKLLDHEAREVTLADELR